MRHNKKRGMKLGTDASHTKAMKKSLIRALLANDRIKTLDVRAKAIRPDVDRVITWAKRGDIASRRLAIAKVGDAQIVGDDEGDALVAGGFVSLAKKVHHRRIAAHVQKERKLTLEQRGNVIDLWQQ